MLFFLQYENEWMFSSILFFLRNWFDVINNNRFWRDKRTDRALTPEKNPLVIYWLTLYMCALRVRWLGSPNQTARRLTHQSCHTQPVFSLLCESTGFLSSVCYKYLWQRVFQTEIRISETNIKTRFM